jgi:hypothetical protein
LEILSKDAEEKQKKKKRQRATMKEQEINHPLHLPPIGLYVISSSRQDHMSGTKEDSNSDILLFFSA